MKNGRTGSRAVSVLIQAPPMPKDNNTNGQIQHAEAPKAANSAPIPSHDRLLPGVPGSSFMKSSLVNKLNIGKESKPCCLEQSQENNRVVIKNQDFVMYRQTHREWRNAEM